MSGNVLLLNDTSDYHSGSAEVIRNIPHDSSLKQPASVNWDSVTHVILNGEGTMHDDNPTAHAWLNLLREAQSRNIPTEIVNTVWQNMHHSTSKILSKCINIEVREKLSQAELSLIGIKSSVVPDRSLRSHVPYKLYPHTKIMYGQPFNGNLENPNNYPTINILTDDWNDIVNRLRNTDILVTGRHHEMYAAIKAGCKFIVKKGNTHKNEGFLVTYSNIPTNLTIEETLSNKWDKEWKALFNRVN